MSAIQLIITDAGLAAIASAGTLGPVTIAQVGIGSGSWSSPPPTSTTALLSPVKLLTPAGSSTPSPGRIHITTTDYTADAYTVREIGLYDSHGVLFAIGGGTSEFLVKTADAISMLAVDVDISNAPVGTVVIGDASFEYPPASESTPGVAAIATTAEVNAGTDDTKIVTPLKLANLTTVYVRIAGSTMTGPLILSGDPTAALGAVTKQYADTKLPLAGGTMTGDITLPGSPTSALKAIPKQYVDNNFLPLTGGTISGNLTVTGDLFVGTSLKATNGYTRLPNGLILQWATGTGTSSAAPQTQTISFPIAFPNACLNVSASIRTTATTIGGSGAAQPSPPLINAISTTSVSVIYPQPSSSYTLTPTIFAIGY